MLWSLTLFRWKGNIFQARRFRLWGGAAKIENSLFSFSRFSKSPHSSWSESCSPYCEFKYHVFQFLLGWYKSGHLHLVKCTSLAPKGSIKKENRRRRFWKRRLNRRRQAERREAKSTWGSSTVSVTTSPLSSHGSSSCRGCAGAATFKWHRRRVRTERDSRHGKTFMSWNDEKTIKKNCVSIFIMSPSELWFCVSFSAVSSPAWLKELKSKKRLSQYDSEA